MEQMLVRAGKSVYQGIAVGKIFVLKKTSKFVEKELIEDRAAEAARFEAARGVVIKQLKELYEKTLQNVGEAEAMIFEVHQMLVEDPDYTHSIVDVIENDGVKAEYAVQLACQQYSELFANMEDAYMRERAADIRDISDRMIAVLSDAQSSIEKLREPVILLAEDLAPSETVQFDKDKLLALVTQKGSTNSHTAILARTMNLPSLVNADVEIDTGFNGMTAIVDGFEGLVYINPDNETLEKLQRKKAQAEAQRALLQKLKGKETVTKSGQKVKLYANIGSVKDVEAVLEQDAEGIGLFRSEFLYLGRDRLPDEEEQFEAYKAVLSRMNGKKVIIRTLDIGADKQAEYLKLAAEENPALGIRAIRLCLTKPEIFKTQLRALFRASVYGKLAIMIPFITSVTEILQVKEIIEEVKNVLQTEKIPYGDVELGIMIETPAAAMISDLLAPHVDFFSIGTNDLSQYTLAIDRQNPALEPFFDIHHEAVLRFIKMTVDNAHACKIWCGICGELGADLSLTERFLEMGVDELSVSPAYILELREKIRACH